ncbi:MAG: molybdenum ABC transporter ATP-binding protein [Gammaproteobacteria bacterium]|nr:molybdenum ABC transporter ATP-binding protein [Gammaproteobacteria bacterium]MDD9896208.1 molybdenum ABC transporter ATP-binding protein [Gammaproteobacteria bacterium]MDD9957307.1 molybdenum ABC transporter ATP-binding protein [Gammaproteobacteria bacterium]
MGNSTIDLQINHQLSERGGRSFSLNVDLQLPGQGITAVFGASGSGKTTLLRCLAGLESDATAQISVKGSAWQSDQVSVPTHKRRVGYVFQESSLFPHLSVEKNILYGSQRAPTPIESNNYQHIIDLMGLKQLLDQYPDQLSGGERQRVAIARALVIDPELLLMDEPLASLDVKRKQEILPYLESMHASLDVPIIYVTHSVDEVARLADHLVVLEEGAVIASGSLADVLSNIELPIQLGEDTGVVIEATVVERDAEWHLLRTEFDGGELWVRDGGDALGSNIRIRVLARDVSLTLNPHTDSSIINRVWTRVDNIQERNDPSMLLVSLIAGDKKIIARLSRRSAHQLGITIGKEVWAQIKGVAILR